MSHHGAIYLSDKLEVRKYLDWDTLIPGAEAVLSDISHKEETESIQPTRLMMNIPDNSMLVCMPAYSGKQKIFGCKVVSSFPKNVQKKLSSILGSVLLLDSDTGNVKMICDGGEITAWRTGASSAAVTKYLHKGPKNVLAVFGAGVQAKGHALALHHQFKFQEVRVWNRTYEKAVKLCEELGPWAKPYKSNEKCARGANVIVTATFSSKPLVRGEWLTPGTHINAIGSTAAELTADIYKQGTTFVDTMSGAHQELQGLLQAGVVFCCEIGAVMRGVVTVPDKPFTIFQSLGMALEDVIAAELIYKKYTKEHS